MEFVDRRVPSLMTPGLVRLPDADSPNRRASVDVLTFATPVGLIAVIVIQSPESLVFALIPPDIPAFPTQRKGWYRYLQ
jgi:hypothetical protein